MLTMRFSRMPGAVLVVVLLVGVATAATAVGRATAPVSLTGGAGTAVKVVRGTSFFTQSREWTDLTGASQTVQVPAGQTALVVARFSAASECTKLDPDFELCEVRILIGGQTAG